MTANTSSTVYEIITERITSLLEKGTIPWAKPWRGGAEGCPRNLDNKPYQGLNLLLLGCQGWDSSFWGTYKAIQALGGQVKKGEKGSPVIFWKLWEKDHANEHGDKETDYIPVLRYYTVFNACQAESLPEKYYQKPETVNPDTRDDRGERLCKDYLARENIPLKPDCRAFYRPSEDLIGMPAFENFISGAEYYSTIFHEMGHSTGHEKRLARRKSTEARFHGDSDYSKEELVAELSAAYLSGLCGFEERTIENSAAYIQGWLRALRNDPKLLVQAASQAKKASEYILHGKQEEGLSNE